MKKIILFLIISLQILPMRKVQVAHSLQQESVTYAKALDDCYLFKSSVFQDEVSNVYFVVPKSYFVMIIKLVSDNCLKVQYDKYVGYVKSSTVEIATFIPNVATLQNVYFDIKQTSGTQIWSLPDVDSGSVLTTISAGTKNIQYIAQTYGLVPRGGVSNIWFYVAYTSDTNMTNFYEGYVYSENITNLSDIAINEENNPLPTVSTDVDNETGDQSVNQTFFLSPSLKTIIIAIISIPIILLFSIILYIFVKKFRKNTILDENNKINYGQIYASNDAYNSNSKTDLQNSIEKFKMKSFVKKVGPNQNKRNIKNKKTDYPNFPDFGNDDDLL